jgi:hypothetical protein
MFMKKIFAFFAAIAAMVTISCSKQEIATETSLPSVSQPQGITTKGVGDKTPSVFVYVETNDVNPLNAMDYWLDDGTTFFDYVCFFSSNIHKETVNVNNNDEVRPTLYLNPELCPYLCNNGTPVTTYTDAIRNNGQSPILAVLGDWANFGLSTMNDTQAYQFAYILCCVVTQCGFDGILLDDEYSGTNTIVPDSYSKIIIYFKQLCPNKKVFVFDWGGTNYISSTAAALIDGVHHGYFGYYLSNAYCNITGIGVGYWSPISLLLGQTYSNNALSTIQTWAGNATNAGYGQIMLYNLRSRCDVDPLPVLNRIAEGAGWPTPVTCTDGCRSPLTPITGGCTITYDMALNCCN